MLRLKNQAFLTPPEKQFEIKLCKMKICQQQQETAEEFCDEALDKSLHFSATFLHSKQKETFSIEEKTLKEQEFLCSKRKMSFPDQKFAFMSTTGFADKELVGIMS